MSDIRVLIVEDEPLIAEDIAQGLEKNEFLVSAVVYSKEDAIEQLNINLPDLVLLDINLSGEMSGIEIAEKINTL